MPVPPFTPIARPVLFEAVDAAVAARSGRVLLVSAPAGAGKTVLLADWATRRCDLAVHWVGAADEFTAAADPAAAVRARLATTTPGVLILDDAHLLDDPAALAGLERFLLEAPPELTVVVCARFDPPIRWHLLELQARLTRLGAAELALTPEEIGGLCAEHGVTLDEAGRTALSELTGGWAALVRITAVHLAAHRDELAVLATRLPHAVVDYLGAELLDGLSPTLREFLTVTGVPATFTEKLADDLVGGGAGHCLDELDRLGFPLVRTPRGTELWFSYHPMLRAHFRAEADRLGRDRIRALHLRAARWLHAAGHLPAALTHLCAAGDRAPLLDFVTAAGPTLVLDGAGSVLFAELTRTANDVLDDPYVWALRVLDALVHGDTADAVACLDLALARRTHRTSFAPRAWTDALLRALAVDVAAATGRLPEPPGPVEPTGHADIDCYTAIQVATAAIVRGQLADGEELLHRGLALADHACHPRLAVRAAARLAFAAGAAESTTAMRQRAGRALALAREHDLLDSPDAAQAMTVAAAAAYLRGEQPEPTQLAAALAMHRDRDGAHSPLVGRHGHLVGQLLAAETGTAVDALHRDMIALLDHDGIAASTAALLPHVVWALLRRHEPRTARLLVDRARNLLGDVPDVTLARGACAHAEEKPRQTLELVEPLLREPAALRPSSRVTARLLCAIARYRLDRPRAAGDMLDRAVRDAADEEFVRPFLDVPGAVALLDVFSGRFGRDEPFVARVRANPAARREIARPALTDTELLVLKQLPTGRTVGQIAADLGVSINTVKTHLRGIYGKLGANSRVGALDTARRSGLL